MKLEEIKKLNLPHYKYDPLALTVGDVVAEAKIASTPDAWVDGYAKDKKDSKYHHSFQGGISQQEDPRYPGSRNEPKDFPAFMVGIIDGEKNHYVAYATSINHDTKKVHTLRITPLNQIIDIWDYKLILKSDSSSPQHRGL